MSQCRAEAGAPGRAKPGSVLVLAPQMVTPQPDLSWLGTAMQRTLVADLTRHLSKRIQLSNDSTTDFPAAMVLAQKCNAQRIITSSIQLAGDEIRFTGAVIDVNHERVIAALKVTGRINDLFEMEDELDAQAVRVLTPPAPLQPASAAPLAIRATGPVRIESSASQGGLEYARPYHSNRFQAAEDRYFNGNSQYGYGLWYGGWNGSYGLGWGYSIYPTASPGWAW